MSNTNVLNIPSTFRQFLCQADADYRQNLVSLALFNREKTVKWTHEQKKYFAAIFYHIRGHFINFMWYLANFAPDEQTKSIVMQNIHEELGQSSKFSHEKLYERFATECGVNIHDEIVNETHYLPFAQRFNKEHLRWLTEHDADERLAAFAAYERLDNIDYPYLTEFANSLEVSQHALTFFRVHTQVEHFESTIEQLLPIWQASNTKVKESFNFIYSHQYQMWQQLSDTVFSLVETSAA